MTTEDDNHIAMARLFEKARLKAELDPASQSHLQDCEICRQKLSWLETAAKLGAQDHESEPPQTVIKKVLRIGQK